MHRSSYCGVNCEKCKVYIATVNNNETVRKEVIDEWSVLYKRDFKDAEMVCKGCKSDTRFMLCSQCDITYCNQDRNIENCEDCNVFPNASTGRRCERIQRFFDFHKNNNTGNVFD